MRRGKINMKITPLSLEDLFPGWYVGRGRNANVAYWTGETFLTIGKQFDKYVIKDEGLMEHGGCFIPTERVKIQWIIRELENKGV